MSYTCIICNKIYSGHQRTKYCNKTKCQEGKNKSIKNSSNKWRIKNPEKMRQYSRKYLNKTKEKWSEYRKEKYKDKLKSKTSFKVTLQIPEYATLSDVKEYIIDAVRTWKGQCHPDEDPMFELDGDSVRCTLIKKGK